jgi:hypothetical protein
MRWILHITSLPALIGSWLFFAILCAITAVKNPTLEPGLILSGYWAPWVSRFWRYSNAFGRVTIYQHKLISGDPSSAKRVRTHEQTHIRQSDDDMLKAFLVGVVAGLCAWNYWLFIGIWCSGFVWLMVHYLASMFRYGANRMQRVYRQAEHERAAYAQSDLNVRGTTWLERYYDED